MVNNIYLVTYLLICVILAIPYLQRKVFTMLSKIIPAGRSLAHRRLPQQALTDNDVSRHTIPHVDGPYPKEFLDAQFNKAKQKDKYIGIYDNAGVIYADDFIKQQYANVISIREPASYTPYIEDYVLQVDRPSLQPFPRY